MTIRSDLKKQFIQCIREAFKDELHRATGTDIYLSPDPVSKIIGFLLEPAPDNRVYVSFEIWIRFSELEELRVQFLPDLSRDVKKSMPTIGNRLDNMLGCELYWLLCQDYDMLRIADLIMRAYRAIAVPFFTRFSSLSETVALLSLDNDEATQYCTMDLNRAAGAIGGAYLLKDRELFDNIREYKDKYLAERAKGSLFIREHMYQYTDLRDYLLTQW